MLCLRGPVTCIPILKGTVGEFLPLGNASAEIQSQMCPVARGTDTDETLGEVRVAIRPRVLEVD
ncbi:hypothetical protein GCM10012285_03170 [Streptomyces kronopolitis]|uniref:Uncharacterized protein n=1 Tax=Streptomyces kronopolitis TaxID=1612435 RepID=A0ABQ2IZU5_9ACTN|nr:hypothetical protein GCM10012285_03170 [Streptomyces kronopolitis]